MSEEPLELLDTLYCASHAYSTARVSTILHLLSTLPYLTTTQVAFYSTSSLLHSHATQAQSSSPKLYPSQPNLILHYPTLPCTTQTPPKPWIAHSTLPQRYSPFVLSIILFQRCHWSSQILYILPSDNQAYCDRGAVGAPRYFIFSLCITNYIVSEVPLELLDTPYSPFAWLSILIEGTIGAHTYFIFSRCIINYIVQELPLELPDTSYSPFA